MTDKHTSGPWWAEGNSIWGKEHGYTVEVAEFYFPDENEWQSQDLLLMTAAPDMLDALREAKSEMRDWGIDHPVMKQIDAAIAKATGTDT